MGEPNFVGLSEEEVRHIVDIELERSMDHAYRQAWWQEAEFFGKTPLQLLHEERYRKLWLYARAMGATEEVDLKEIERLPD